MCLVQDDNNNDVEKAKISTRETSILDGNSCLSEWFLAYLDPIMKLGAKKVLQKEDIGPVCERISAKESYSHVYAAWREEKEKVISANKLAKEKAETSGNPKKYKKKSPNLAWAILKTYGYAEFNLAVLYYVLSAFLQFVPVLILNDLVTYLEDVELGKEGSLFLNMNAWIEVIVLGLAPILVTMLQTKHSVTLTKLGIYAKTSCAALLYEKSLSISATGRSRTSTGQVVNMMSNDTAQLQRFLQFLGFVIVAPMQIIISLVLIYMQVGHSMWVGVLYMVLLAPVNVKMFATLGQMRREVLKHSDSRVKMMNEILNGIRVIKFYAWERPFRKEVAAVRKKELKALTKLTYVSSIGFSVILMSAPVIQPILVFLTYVNVQNEEITAAKAFTTIALFNIMRFPFAFLPMGFLQYIQAKISIRRIGAYMDLPTLADCVVPQAPPSAEDGSPESQVGSITMQKASFGWINPKEERGPLQFGPVKKKKKKSKKEEVEETEVESIDQQKFTTIEDISFTIKTGELVAVIGEVGSGKSSLISAILGEMEPVDDSKVYVPGRVEGTSHTALCTQTPWVVNDTLKGNIIFGRVFNEERYNHVVEACALKADLNILPAGDMTEIGERGINLSGGQKARVCLARAMYGEDTKVLMLDDPLSAVDSHVGEHIFAEAITGEISRGRTRILVTHHVHFLPRCDSIIVLEGGKMKHWGTYDELISQGVEFKGLEDFESDEDSNSEVTESVANEEKSPRKLKKRSSSIGEDKTKLKKKGQNLISEEDRETGSVSNDAYFHYGKAGGILMFVCVFFAQALNRALEVGGSFWLAYWATETTVALVEGNPFSTAKTMEYVGIYGAFGLASVVMLGVRGYLLAQHRLKASTRLHDDVTDSILHAPVSFFDVTPNGRVLNRFAYDTDRVDLELSSSLSQALSTMFSIFGSIGAIIVATKGIMIIPILPISYVYYLIQKWFRKTSTELQRVTSITGSPIFADFSQTLSGTPSVRAFGMQTRFFDNCKSSFDTNNAAYSLVQLSALWLGLRLDFIGSALAVLIAGISVGTSRFNLIPAAWLGLGLSSAIEITGYLKHAVRMIANIEADLTSVERILSYTNEIDQEPSEEVPEKDPKEGTWPTKGEISLNNISMRYRDGPLVLKNLSIAINGGEKIGIVGRTGSGKSSLMIALFRITDLEPDGGAITIDGVNTEEIGVKTLRSNLSIIPQDPVLFSNSVRYNLDPFGTIDDKEIWESLKKVNLDHFISGLENGLQEQVTEGGENFSQGQRQLLCIARSVLRKPKILIMDEATASIDNNTDALIQSMVRENFANATVLTIAHRLNTIMDSDRVLVLDNGHVAEFDSPSKLLSDTSSIFYSMVEKSRTSKSSSSNLAGMHE